MDDFWKNSGGKMSFTKYVENLSYKTPQFDLEEYKSKLREFLYSVKETKTLARYFLNLNFLKNSIYDFPYKEEFLISLVAGDISKINGYYSIFEKWSNSDISSVRDHILQYKSYFSRPLNIEMIEETIDSLIQQKLELMKGFSDINLQISVKAIFSEDLSNKYLISDGKDSFVFDQDAVQISEESNGNLKEQFLKYYDTKILSLYSLQPFSKRSLLKETKKNISLGRQEFIGGIFTEFIPNESGDIWKVKIDKKHLFKIGNIYRPIEDTAPVKWLEML